MKLEKPSVCAAKIYFVNILFPLSLFTCCKTKLKKLFFQKEKWNICLFQKNIYSVRNLFIRKKKLYTQKAFLQKETYVKNICFIWKIIFIKKENVCVRNKNMNLFLRLRETHNTLQLPVFIYLLRLLFVTQRYPE